MTDSRNSAPSLLSLQTRDTCTHQGGGFISLEKNISDHIKRKCTGLSNAFSTTVTKGLTHDDLQLKICTFPSHSTFNQLCMGFKNSKHLPYSSFMPMVLDPGCTLQSPGSFAVFFFNPNMQAVFQINCTPLSGMRPGSDTFLRFPR